MKTFDYEQVGSVLTPLMVKFDECDHGEGKECATLDKHLECCATICFEVVTEVRRWALNVFCGEVVFDPAADNKWHTEVAQLHSRATRLWQRGRKAELPCWDLPGQNKLASALWELGWLLNRWVSPKLSVGPVARAKLDLNDEQITAIWKQLDSLPPFEPVSKKR